MESDDSPAFFREYHKPVKSLAVAPLIRMRDDQIGEILLVFDAGGFVQPPVVGEAPLDGNVGSRGGIL